MLGEIKETWRLLRGAEPGKRFTDYHHHHQSAAHGKVSRIVTIVLGVVIIAVGIIALPAPGPGSLVIAIGAAFVARESRGVAAGLDWLELKLRDVALGIASAWRRASLLQRVLVTLAGVGMVALVVYVAYAVVIRA